MCDSSLGVGTGTLDELVGSHTRLVIYPTLTICYQRVVIHASLDTRFKGEASSDLPSYHQITEVTLTKGSPERSGCMHMDKQVTTFYSGYTLLHKRHWDSQNRGSVAHQQTWMLYTRIPRQQPWGLVVLSFYSSLPYSTRDPHDIMKWCHDHLLWSSSGKTTAHVHQNHWCSSAHLLASSPEPPTTMKASEPLCLFLNPIFAPMTLCPRYFSAPSYWSLNLFTHFSTKHRQAS